MKYLIVSLLIGFGSRVTGQIDWNSTSDWKVYKIRGRALFSYPADTLKNFKSYSLNRDSILGYIQAAKTISKDSTPLWMGEYVASCTKDGKVLKLEISTYGGFFYCESDRRYYKVPDALKKEWMDYISGCFNALYL